MNNNNLEKFIEDIESIKMTQNEKNKIRQNLANFAMEYNPAPSPYRKLFQYSRQILVTSFIAIISIGSISQFLSKDALPGQTLYPVKIAHEQFKIATSNDKVDKISYEIKRTEKRIQEAAQLAQEEKLDITAQEEIVVAIQKQTRKVKDQIETVKKKDPKSALALNTELKTTIKTNSELLRKATTPEKVSTEIKNINTSESEKESIVDNSDVQDIEMPTELLINTVEVKTENINEVTNKTDNLDIPIIAEEIESELNNETESTKNNTVKILDVLVEQETVEIVPTEIEFHDNSLSSARKLLDSLDDEVKEIEALEDIVEQAITEQKDDKKLGIEDVFNEVPESVISQKDEIVADIDIEESTNTETTDIEKQEDIKTIEESKEIQRGTENAETSDIIFDDIKNIQQEILEIKQDIADSLSKSEITGYLMENESELGIQSEILIQENEYEEAFITLEKIKAYYLELSTTETIDNSLEAI